MDGPSHYTMAEFLMEEAQIKLNEGDPDGRAAFLITSSQIHATLAAAAAAALGPSSAEDHAWREMWRSLTFRDRC